MYNSNYGLANELCPAHGVHYVPDALTSAGGVLSYAQFAFNFPGRHISNVFVKVTRWQRFSTSYPFLLIVYLIRVCILELCWTLLILVIPSVLLDD